jgi:two-component system sensor histidine kinase HydH
VALLATVWTTNRGVRDASSMLVRGQATVLIDSLRARLRTADGALDQAALQAAVDELAGDGLRWVALLDERGDVRVEGGARVAPLTTAELRASEPGVPVEVGGRARVILRRPPELRGGRGRGGPMPLALEFEPTSARALRADARRTLGLGALAAGGFLALAVALVRWSLHQQARERQLEQERRLAGLGRMSAVLAHEIRNPLASLKGNAQLLVRALPEGDKPRAKAQLLVDEAIRLERLTNDLLDFARAGELAVADSDPAALVREVAAELDGARIRVDATGAPARWPLDAARMRRVLANLLDNATWAGDGEVVATVARERDELVIAVRDHGPGVKDEDLPRLFEPFFTRRVQGTGLGLAIAKRLVELHGGTIAAANAEGGGARFTVRIPRGQGG